MTALSIGVRKYRYHSPIISAEWNGSTDSPYGASLINFEPQQEELVLEAYRTRAKLFELYRYYSWVVDRFHISTQAWQLIYPKRQRLVTIAGRTSEIPGGEGAALRNQLRKERS